MFTFSVIDIKLPYDMESKDKKKLTVCPCSQFDLFSVLNENVLFPFIVVFLSVFTRVKHYNKTCSHR